MVCRKPKEIFMVVALPFLKLGVVEEPSTCAFNWRKIDVFVCFIV
jgi:hypothetical protein